MSNLFNRLKSRKTGSINENEPTTSFPSFEEEGFLCPLCHQKFKDHKQLSQHYIDNHAQQSVVENNDTNITQQEIQENYNQEIALWKQQFTVSEESRILLTNELMQEKQRANDFEEGIQSLQKHLKITKAKVVEQSQVIANLKATKDVYDAQLAICSNELLATQNQLKEKQQQIDSLLSRSTSDDVDVLKHELINFQKLSVEKEQQIEKLGLTLIENYQYVQRLDHIENIFNQNLSSYDEMISKNTLQIENEINKTKQFVKLTRERKEKVETAIKSMRNCLNENQTEINDLELQKELNVQLMNDLQKQTNSSRNQIELLNNEIYQLEKTLNELKEEKNQLIQIKMTGDQNEERQSLVRQISLEKDQYEQQTKDLRIQIKQITNERQQIQDEFDNISKQFSQISNEKNQLQNEQTRLNNEIDLLKKQLENNNKDKERQINELNRELSTIREQYTNIENHLREATENNDNQKREIEQIKNDSTKQINQLQQTINQHEQLANKTKIELNTIQKEKDNLVQQLQTTLSQLYAKLDQKENHIKRLSIGIHHSIVLAHKTHEYIQKNIHTNQINILTTIEKAKQDSRLIRRQTLEQIQEEFTSYLTIVHTIILDSKNKLENQIEKDNLNLIEQQKQLDKIKNQYEKLIEEHHKQKQKYEIQLGEVSESLSESIQTADRQREKYEKQITSLGQELESRTKRHEMQLSALTENLAAARSELKINHEKLASIDRIKAEKTDIEERLVVNQDERRVLLERSLSSESKIEKLIADNKQLTKKNTDLEAALQEIARQNQALQMQTNKLSQRRWLDDDDVDTCMKCNHTFNVTQRKHHCRNCGNIFCDRCSSKTAIVAASSKKQKRVCDQCYKELTS